MTEDELEKARKLHEDLVKKIQKYDYYYYQEDNPLITDAEYDQLTQALLKLEENHPELKQNSISSKVGGVVSEKFGKIEHIVPMLSLNNIFDIEEIEEFIDKIKKFLKYTDFIDITAELKIDGLSFSAVYINGRLDVASTRGDGYNGENITENAKTIKDLPHYIDTKIKRLEVRGEIYIDKNDFEELNHNQENNGKQKFANPRNAAAGSLRQLDAKITKSRPLKYFVYSIGDGLDEFADTQFEVLRNLENLGFATNPNRKLCKNLMQLTEFYTYSMNERDKLNYEIDGVVYKVNDNNLAKRLGFVGRAPRFAVAHKFPAILGRTKLLDIIIQVGRTGALTPVAVLEPISIGGVIVSRASLHNFEEIYRKDIRIGDIVALKRAGDVIPQINNVIVEERKNSIVFELPLSCPSCGEKVTKSTDDVVLRCNNGLECPDQIIERMVHFVSKNCIGIEGLGRKQIEFLVENKFASNPIDIMQLPSSEKLTTIEKQNGWGKQSIKNMVDNIIKSKSTILGKFIFALGIRHVGEITSKEIAAIFQNIDNFLESMIKLSAGDQNTRQELENQDGFGSKIIDSLSDFFSIQHNIDLVRNLSKEFTFESIKQIESPISGKIVVFTGSLSLSSRNEAKQKAESLGAKVSNSVTSKTDYLIIGDKPGSKLSDAQKLGIKILTEEEWANL